MQHTPKGTGEVCGGYAAEKRAPGGVRRACGERGLFVYPSAFTYMHAAMQCGKSYQKAQKGKKGAPDSRLRKSGAIGMRGI